MKRCGKCGQEKDISDFHKNKSKKDGRATECKLCKRQQDIKYREENEEYYREYCREYRKEHKNDLADKKKEYIANNREKHWKRQHIWYIKNIESVKNRISKYKKEHPKQYQMYSNKRRALKKTLIYIPFNFQDIISKYGDKCFYCNGLFEEIDHYIPLSRGGSHTLENIRPSCERCNLSKSNKLPEEFIKYKTGSSNG